jgi:hypothetical protein
MSMLFRSSSILVATRSLTDLTWCNVRRVFHPSGKEYSSDIAGDGPTFFKRLKRAAPLRQKSDNGNIVQENIEEIQKKKTKKNSDVQQLLKLVLEQNLQITRQLGCPSQVVPFVDKDEHYSKCPPFDEENYLAWTTMFKTRLSGRLREILVSPELISEADFRNMNNCLFSALIFCLSSATPSAMGLIAGKLTTLDGDGLALWNFLRSEDERLTWQKVLQINRCYGEFEIKAGEESSVLRARVVHFLDRHRSIKCRMTEDQDNAVLFVQSIIRTYPAIADQIMGSFPDVNVTLEQVSDRFNSLMVSRPQTRSALMAEEINTTAAIASTRKKFCNFCRREGHLEMDCWSKHRGVYGPRLQNQNSFVTKRRNIYASNFSYKNNSNGGKFSIGNGNENGRDFSNGRQNVQDSQRQSENRRPTDQNEVNFIIDSGASSHMCPSCILSESQPSSQRIQTADGNIIPASSCGKFGDLTSVLQAPGLTHNLLSVSSAAKDGNTFVFDKNGVSVFKSDKIDIIGNSFSSAVVGKDGLYRLPFQANSVPQTVLANTVLDSATVLVADVVDDNEAFKWHCRLGHPSTRLLKHMFLHQMVTSTAGQPRYFRRKDLKELASCGCFGCIAGKQTMEDVCRRPHRIVSAAVSSTPIVPVSKVDVKPGRLVCVDLLTSSVPSFHGKFVFALTIVDVDSRYLWVYPLKTKNSGEVLEAIKAWIRQIRMDKVEPQYFTTIRSDSGSEFTNKLIKSAMSHIGIKQEFSAPQHHVYLIERANRTLQSTTRAMLHHANMKQGYWLEALQCACYTLNRLPTKCNPTKTRYESYFGCKPDISNLRIFGSVCFRKKYDVQRKIWDTESTRCRFMGYGESGKSDRAWKLLNTKNSQFHFSDNVVFIETNMLFSLNDVATLPDIVNPNDVEPFVLSVYHEPGTGGVIVEELEVAVDPISNPTEIVLKTHALYHQQVNSALTARVKSSVEIATPSNLDQALSGDDKEHWMKSIQDEVDSLVSNGTLEVMKRPHHPVKALPIKYVFKIKTNKEGKVERYKTRFTAMGNLQDQDMDYEETFAPVVRQSSVRILLSLAAQNNYPVHQMDVDTAFLYGTLAEEDEPVFLKLPINYPIPADLQGVDPKGLICRVRKGIYGLKQSPKLWNDNFNSSMISLGFRRFSSDMGLYSRIDEGKQLFVGLYVDDLVIVGSDIDTVVKFKQQIGGIYKMKDLGPINQLLGMDVTQDLDKGTVSICQSKYIQNILEKFNMLDCNSSPIPMDPGLHLKPAENSDPERYPYAQVIGSLLYLTSCTRPDIAFAVNTLSRYLSCHDQSHSDAAIHIMRYLKGTIHQGLIFSRQSSFELAGFSDSDHARCKITRRSVTGYVFTLGGAPISWKSKTQPTVALSSTEAEYMALTATICEAEYLQRVISEFGVQCPKLQLFSDNNGAIAIIKKGSTTDRTKHIDIQHHFIHERYVDGHFALNEMRTQLMPADLFTKPLAKPTFLCHRDVLMKVVSS